LTDEAKATLESVSMASGRKATIKQTGTGWLNVRSAPGLDGEILGKATVGDAYTILEESTSWVKIKLSGEVEGWVSSTYVTLE